MTGRRHGSVTSRLAPLTPVALVVAVQQVFFPVPAGLLLRGVVVGLLTAMVSVGMALVYRANRVLNFAQGDLGYAPASLAVLLVVSTGLPWLLAFASGAVAAVVVGAASEVLIIRRFRRSPRLVLMVATLGLSQLLLFVGLYVPQLFDQRPGSQRIPPPFDLTFTVDPLIFTANDLLVLVGAPLAIVGIGLFLHRTQVGTAIRAAADRSDRASLLGIPVNGLHTAVWAAAGLLAFLGLFLRAGIIGLPIGSFFSFGALLRALAALMLGRMTRMPTIVAGAVALGILETGVVWNASSPLLVEPIIALVAVGALLMLRRDVTRLETETTSSWIAADEVRPVPAALRPIVEVRLLRGGSAALLAVTVLVLPRWLPVDVSLKVSAVFIWAIVALSVVVVTGWAGQLSLAQVGFMAVGAAVGATATNEWGLDLGLALLAAGLAGMLMALVVGLPALRMKGLFLAVTTLGFGLATSAWLLNERFFDWVPTGRVERPALFGHIDLDSPTRIYYFAAAVLVVVLLGLHGIRHSRTGRVLVALRENERAAQALGVSAARTKLTAFAISGFVAAVGGAVFVHHQQAFDTTSYEPSLGIVILMAAVIGGLGSLTGGVLGAVYIQGCFLLLPSDWRFLSSALGVLFVLLVVPGGLGSVLYRVRDLGLGWVARRRGIAAPSIVAEERPPPDVESIPSRPALVGSDA